MEILDIKAQNDLEIGVKVTQDHWKRQHRAGLMTSY